MTAILRAAAKASEEASQHVINAKIAVEEFFSLEHFPHDTGQHP